MIDAIRARLLEIRRGLEHWSHQEKEAAARISLLINELCDMRDRGDITQADLMVSCRDGECHCERCEIGG